VPGELCLSTNPPPAPGECRRQSQLGESCADVTCVDGLGCDPNFVCITPVGDGAFCTLGDQCASGNCASMVCAPTPTVRHAICH